MPDSVLNNILCTYIKIGQYEQVLWRRMWKIAKMSQSISL